MSEAPHLILRLAPENVAPLWPQVAELIRPALAMVCTHTVVDVHQAVLAMKAQLWVEVRGSKVIAAVVTEFISYPVGLFVRAWLAGAHKDEAMDTNGFIEALDQWRSINGAVGFEAIGRHGWMRKIPGAQPEGMIMRWVV